MAITDSDIERYEDDQLVVELRDLPLVQRELDQHFHVTSQSADASPELDLGLLALPELQSQIAPLWQDSRLVELARQDRLQWYTSKDDITNLDLLLFALRRYFRHEFDGWTVTMAKHRILDRVEGWPYVKGGLGKLEPLPDHPSIPAGAARNGPRVGILDTGIYPHADLVGRYVGEPISGFAAPEVSTAAHATFIAGVILQRAPETELVVREGLSADGINASSWAIAKQMVGFRDEDVAVLNLSFGCATADRVAPLVLRRAVDRLSPSTVLVAAAGNNGDLKDREAAGLTAETPMWPAAFDDVIAVGALTPKGQRALFSPHVPLIDLLAPGVDVESTFLPGEVRIQDRDEQGKLQVSKETRYFGEKGYARWSGTSFAAANVSGEIAARMKPGHVSAREALDQLLHPTSPTEGDIRPFTL